MTWAAPPLRGVRGNKDPLFIPFFIKLRKKIIYIKRSKSSFQISKNRVFVSLAIERGWRGEMN